jgi:hypothetical protein
VRAACRSALPRGSDSRGGALRGAGSTRASVCLTCNRFAAGWMARDARSGRGPVIGGFLPGLDGEQGIERTARRCAIELGRWGTAERPRGQNFAKHRVGAEGATIASKTVIAHA